MNRSSATRGRELLSGPMSRGERRVLIVVALVPAVALLVVLVLWGLGS